MRFENSKTQQKLNDESFKLFEKCNYFLHKMNKTYILKFEINFLSWRLYIVFAICFISKVNNDQILDTDAKLDDSKKN